MSVHGLNFALNPLRVPVLIRTLVMSSCVPFVVEYIQNETKNIFQYFQHDVLLFCQTWSNNTSNDNQSQRLNGGTLLLDDVPCEIVN